MVHETRKSNLSVLIRREKIYTAAYVLTTGASILSAGTIFLSFAFRSHALVLVIPFVTVCLATLAISSKQLQVVTYSRIKKVARDNRTEEVLWGAIVAFQESRGGPIPETELRRLIGALLAIRSDAGSGQKPSATTAVSPMLGTSSESPSDAWDPISVFLAG
jgi:hypothetical protein